MPAVYAAGRMNRARAPIVALLGFVALGVALGATRVTAAEPPPADLSAKVDELSRALADLPSALEALHQLEARLDALTHEVARLSGTQSAEPELRRALDELRARLGELETRFGTAQLAERTAAPGHFKYDDGLVFTSRPVEVKLNAAVQPRYEGVIRPAPTVNASTFELHHAVLALGATFFGFASIQTRFDFGARFVDAGGIAMVRDLYVDVRPLQWLTIRGGRFRVPFSRQKLTSELRQTFLERSLATRALGLDYDEGALVEGRFLDEKLLAQLAVTNGAAAATNDNLDLAYTARVVAQPLGPLAPVEGDRARSPKPRVAFGVSFQYNLQPTDLPPPLDDQNHDGRIDNVEILLAGAEVAARWRGFAVEGEYYFRQERAGFGRPPRSTHSGYVQASAMAWRGLELAARFSYAQLPSLRPAKIGVLGDAPSAGWELDGVANYYVWNESLKAQLGYAYRNDTAADPFDPRNHSGHVLEVQLQTGF